MKAAFLAEGRGTLKEYLTGIRSLPDMRWEDLCNIPSFVPALYQIMSESSGWPMLRDPYLGSYSGYLSYSDDLVPIANEQRTFLAPVSIGDWLELGSVGTPILTPAEAEGFLRDARREVRPGDWQPDGASCLRFVPTADGRFALFPDSGLYEPTFDIGISAKTSEVSFQLDRLSMPWLTKQRRMSLGLPTDGGENATVSRDACRRIALDTRQPGSRYAGRCEPVDCGGPCTPLLRIDYTTGQTVLGGCLCEGQRR